MIKILMEILSMLSGPTKSSSQKQTAPQQPKQEKGKRVYITPYDIITSSGRYPDRANSSELTPQVIAEIEETARCINALLNELEWEDNVSISSGFRTSASNAATKGAAKKSSHMLGLAVDIVQPKNDNKLGKLIRSKQANKGNDGILAKNELMMEAIEHTIGQNTSWVHLDRVKRPFRASFEFKP